MAGGLAGGRSDRDRVEGAHAVVGELGYALELERTLAGWDALVYPMDNVGAIHEAQARFDSGHEKAQAA